MKTYIMAGMILALSVARGSPLSLGYDAQVGAWIDVGIPVTMGQMALFSEAPDGLISYGIAGTSAALAYAWDGHAFVGDYALGTKYGGRSWVGAWIPFTLSEAMNVTFDITGTGAITAEGYGALLPGTYCFVFQAMAEPGLSSAQGSFALRFESEEQRRMMVPEVTGTLALLGLAWMALIPFVPLKPHA